MQRRLVSDWAAFPLKWSDPDGVGAALRFFGENSSRPRKDQGIGLLCPNRRRPRRRYHADTKSDVAPDGCYGTLNFTGHLLVPVGNFLYLSLPQAEHDARFGSLADTGARSVAQHGAEPGYRDDLMRAAR